MFRANCAIFKIDKYRFTSIVVFPEPAPASTKMCFFVFNASVVVQSLTLKASFEAMFIGARNYKDNMNMFGHACFPYAEVVQLSELKTFHLGCYLLNREGGFLKS